MGQVLDKCCCTNDSKLKEFEDYNTPDIARCQPMDLKGLKNYQKGDLLINESNSSITGTGTQKLRRRKVGEPRGDRASVNSTLN